MLLKLLWDGLSKGGSRDSAGAVVFRDARGAHPAGFGQSLGHHITYCAEVAAILAINVAADHGRKKLWLEMESSLSSSEADSISKKIFK